MKSIIRTAVAVGALASAVGVAAPAASAGTTAAAFSSGRVSATSVKFHCGPTHKKIQVCTGWSKSGLVGEVKNFNSSSRRGIYGVQFINATDGSKDHNSWYGTKTRTFGAYSTLKGWDLTCDMKKYQYAVAMVRFGSRKPYTYYWGDILRCKDGRI
ncbi:hypothetical protein [Actinoallomurus sp. CA-150999]|uniref:hypothetical protein n=1 Tax=Actinoallomurus sp. CA-150999 TaxID=3239887 RepID=UPI003D939A6D